MIVLSNNETTVYGIYEKVVGVPASSLSQLRGPWPENVEDPWHRLHHIARKVWLLPRLWYLSDFILSIHLSG